VARVIKKNVAHDRALGQIKGFGSASGNVFHHSEEKHANLHTNFQLARVTMKRTGASVTFI
jgi:hypothetical protein